MRNHSLLKIDTSLIIVKHFRESLTYFRGGDNDEVRKELQDIISSKNARRNLANKSFLETATCGEFLRPFSCVGILFILLRLSSSSVLFHYTAPFLERAGINLDPILAAVIIGIFRVVSSLIPFVLFSFISKRTAFVLAGSVSTLGMLMGKYLST